MKIGPHSIGRQFEPFVIAEMSGNHNQSLERALEIIDAAAAAGAHAVKLQTYTADTMTLKLDAPGFRIEDERSPWFGRTLYNLYEEAHTPWEWHAQLMQRANELGLECFSTPFDSTAVDFLEELGVSAYKIASFENVDLPLIGRVARTGKPMIISTGMADEAQIEEAVVTARAQGCRDLVLLHCVSGYPSRPEESNLRTLPNLAQRFGVPVGLSDHTLTTATAVAAVALGAVVIEKHMTLCRAEGGPDAAFSLEPDEFKRLVEDCRVAHAALGKATYEQAACEQSSLVFRRSLYVVKDVAEGALFTPENLRCIRPGYGAAPKHLDAVLGKEALRSLTRGTPLDLADVRNLK